MDYVQKEAIRENLPELRENLDIDEVLPWLEANGILTNDNIQIINQEQTD